MNTTEMPVVCRRCGRVLLDPRSVALGLGPGCATGLRPADLDTLAAAAARATAQLPLDFAGDEG
ncbi:hypothetical protein BBK14_07990 [Parafrankia soli]|uniref:Uncharacterized protein n=1 Tax=Parafrankia soli TaxID=2599596 RepID=A0A1S1PIX3_9ACTN|nr:DUF6011 domain-containing protein [Parafrankia soli]OHV21207.1 hypothetical protein BBK14_07990 [Parafrankia soli]